MPDMERIPADQERCKIVQEGLKGTFVGVDGVTLAPSVDARVGLDLDKADRLACGRLHQIRLDRSDLHRDLSLHGVPGCRRGVTGDVAAYPDGCVA